MHFVITFSPNFRGIKNTSHRLHMEKSALNILTEQKHIKSIQIYDNNKISLTLMLTARNTSGKIKLHSSYMSNFFVIPLSICIILITLRKHKQIYSQQRVL